MAGEQAETYLRLMAETELRRAAAREKAVAREGLYNLAVAADALASVAAIDADVAHDIVASYRVALMVRRHGFGTELRFLPHRGGPPPAGVFRAVGIGERVVFDVAGGKAEVLMLAMVIAPDRVVLTITAKPPKGADDAALEDFLNRASAIDERGKRYDANFSGGGDGAEWTGHFVLYPTPGPALRFVDLTFSPGTAPVRIRLDQPRQAPLPITPIDQAGQADRFIDTLIATLFWRGSLRQTTQILRTLLGAGVIEPGSPALGRLVTVGRNLGADIPPSLAAVRQDPLPERWQSVLACKDAADGPVGVVPAGVVLPELDGARWVIAGLRSTAGSAELRLLGWGEFDFLGEHQLDSTLKKCAWWARDSGGRWHIARPSEASWNQRYCDLTLELTPPLHPRATSVDIMVTGRTGQVTVTLPLDWRDQS